MCPNMEASIKFAKFNLGEQIWRGNRRLTSDAVYYTASEETAICSQIWKHQLNFHTNVPSLPDNRSEITNL